jgi:hypothetical protein
VHGRVGLAVNAGTAVAHTGKEKEPCNLIHAFWRTQAWRLLRASSAFGCMQLMNLGVKSAVWLSEAWFNHLDPEYILLPSYY